MTYIGGKIEKKLRIDKRVNEGGIRGDSLIACELCEMDCHIQC